MSYSSLCRSCLSSAQEQLYPFELKCHNQQETELTLTVAEMLVSLLAPLNMDDPSHDDLPRQICDVCLNELVQAYNFQQKCVRSEEELKVMFDDLQNPNLIEATEQNLEVVEDTDAYTEAKHDVVVIETHPGDAFIIAGHDYQDAETVDDVLDVDQTNSTDEILYTASEVVSEESPAVKPLKTFTCSVCGILFVRKMSLERHMKKLHPESLAERETEKTAIKKKPIKRDESLKCPKCESYFSHAKTLKNHLKYNRCHIKSFKCSICQRIFVRRNALVKHMLSHDVIKNGQSGGGGDQPGLVLNCVDCSAEFSNAEELTLHMDSHRVGNKKHFCKECGKGFTMFSTLKDHMRTHSGEKPYLCSICGKGFSQNTNMKQHMMRHYNTKPFKCTICTASFVSKGELDAHLRKHSGEHPFVCDTCGSGFTTSSSLVKHKRIHTGERPYSCDYCSMRFSALGTLKNHRRTHTGERPYACKFCERTFSQKSDMVCHTRIHTGERPYGCEVCGQTFLQSSALKSHQKTHQDVPIALPQQV